MNDYIPLNKLSNIFNNYCIILIFTSELIMDDNTLRQYVDEIFLVYDKDRSNTLEVQELAGFFNDVFAKMGDPRRINQQQAMQALASIDRNQDGRATKM